MIRSLTAVDSNNRAIVGGSPATFNVVGNDVLGVGTTLDSVTIARNPAHGTVFVNANNTLTYTPDTGYNDADSFTYTIQTSDGVRSTATVNVTVGNAAANDQLDISLRIVDGSGNPLPARSL